MYFLPGVVVGVAVTLALVVVAPIAIMSASDPYFMEDYEPYAEEFMSLEEVAALYSAYPMAEPDLNAGGYLAYVATPDGGNRTIELVVFHKPRTLEVTGMSLTCWNIGGLPVWYEDANILHHIDHKECF